MISSTSVRLVAPGTSRVQLSAAMSGGNPSSTGAFGSAPISSSVRMKRQRAVIDRVDEARSDRVRHATVRHDRGIVDGRAQGVQVALMKSVVDPLELLRLGAAFFFSRHVWPRDAG